MNEATVTNILNVIRKSSDKTVIFKALVKLRTDVVKDREGIILFRNCDGVLPIVRLLNKPHEKILEVALSILGNCCTDQECCNQALDNKLLSPLLTILKSVPNPLVQCRACRLLGNIAKDDKTKLLNHVTSISQSLCLILEESSESQTTLMAVRATKFLLSEKQFCRSFVKCDGFQILMKILLKLMKKRTPEQGNQDGFDKNVASTSSVDITSQEGQDSMKLIGGRKSYQPREKYFEEVARHLEGVRSDIFDVEILKEQKKIKEYSLPEDKVEIDIIQEILKCAHIMSEDQMHFPLIERLYGCPTAVNCIVSFMDSSSQFRMIALRTVANFAKNHFSVAALSSADAVYAACELLTSTNLGTPLTDAETRYCISIICTLAGDSCNRAKIRRSGALKTLIEKAKFSKSLTEISLILYALNHFQYDQLSMNLLLREGLVGILIRELNEFLNSDDKCRKEKCDEKKNKSRKRKSESVSKKSCKNPKIWSDFFELDSPGSSPRNLSPGSPSSSRSMSPAMSSPKYGPDNDNEADTYSPVCSEDEGDSSDEITSKNQEENTDEMLELLRVASKNEVGNIDESVSDKEEDSDAEEMDKETGNSKQLFTCNNIPTSTIDVIDNLLLRVSLLVANRGELGKPETLKTLVQAISTFGLDGNNFGNCLTNILSESQFFGLILKQDLIYHLYKLKTKNPQLKLSGIMDTLTNVGESGYGRGEIAKFLVKSVDQNTQKKAATAVAFIIRNPKFLHQLLVNCGALNIIFNTILNKNDGLRFEAMDSLTNLAKTIGINLPEYDRNEFNYEQEFDETMDFPIARINELDKMTISSKPETTSKTSSGESSNPSSSSSRDDEEMKFILHRGHSKIPIHFNKKLLTENSVVFNSMLNSDFRECNEREIHLKNYSVNGIKYFLNLINLLSCKQLPNIPPVYHFDSILEAYELSRMYMMEELEKKIFNMILYRIGENTVLKIFEWSLKNFNQDLSEIAINYYLCAGIDSKIKVKLYQEADYSEYSKEWNQMINDTILVKCQNLLVDFRDFVQI